MKKRLLFFMFAAVAAMTVLADEKIQVSNKTLNLEPYSWSYKSEEFNNCESGGFVSWDVTTRTLTLTNFNIDRDNDLSSGSFLTCIEVKSTKSITIEVKGNCNLGVGRGQTLVLHGDATFKGNGKLTIWNRDTQKPAIELAEENITVTADGPSIKLCARGIRGKNNTGIFYMKSGELESASKALIGMGGFIHSYGMGVQTPKGVYFSNTKHTLVFYENDEPVGNNKVVFGAIKYYGFSVCGNEITENNCGSISKMPCVQRGTVEYDSRQNVLKISEAAVVNNTNYPTIRNDKNEGLTISVFGKNIFDYGDNAQDVEAMRLMRNTKILSMYFDASLQTYGENHGIYVGSGMTLDVVGNSYGLDLLVASIAGGNATSKLRLSKEVYVSASGDTRGNGSVRQIKIVNNVDNAGIAVASGEGVPRFIWNREGYALSGVYSDPNNLATGHVGLSTMSSVKWYPLYICGYQVNSQNQGNPVNEYVESGSLYYLNGKLTLNNANINYYNKDVNQPAIKWTGDSDLTLVLKDDNSIKSNYAEAIYAKGNMIIQNNNQTTGNKLSVTGSKAMVSVGQDLTFNAVALASVPEVEAKRLYVNGSKLDITRKLTTDKCELADVTVASTPEAPAYYDSEKQNVVTRKGPVSFVPSSEVTDYPIVFCGMQVNTANAPCIVNKYIRTGSLSVKKEFDNNYRIDMKDMGIYYEESISMFDITSVVNVEFFAEGLNMFNFTDAGSDAHFITGIAKNVSLRSGTILVAGSNTTNAGAIVVNDNSSLNISYLAGNDVHITVPRIYGLGMRTAHLHIDRPYLTVTGNEQGTVRNIKCELDNTSHAELYTTPTERRVIEDDGIWVDAWTRCTGEVKFVAQGENYVPVSNIVSNQKEVTLTKKGQTVQLTATVLPDNATNPSVIWSSRNNEIAIIEEDGKVTAVGEGTTGTWAYPADGSIIYGMDSSCRIIVDFPDPTDVSIEPASILFDSESTGGIYVTANITPADAETEYKWTSSDDNIVTVKENSGKTALIRRVADEGTATITVTTDNGLSATCDVTIHYPITPEMVEFDPRTYTLTEVGQQIKLNPIVTPANCEKLSFTWYTSSDAISLSDDGTVTALRSGSAVVECWACYDGQKWAPGEARIYVELPVIATGLAISPSSVETFYALGESVWLKPVFTPQDVTNDVVRWETTDASVATVDENGFVTIVGWGDCDIIATTTDGSNITARRWIRAVDPSTIVEPVPGTDISLDVNDVTIPIGGETYVGYTVTPAEYNSDIMVEPLGDGDIWNIAQANFEYDWATGRQTLRIKSEEMGQEGDVQFRVRLSYADWEALNAQGIWTEPSDTITIHVRSGIFTAASPEDINVTYRVADFNDKNCAVYAWSDPMNLSMDPDLDDYIVTPAIAPSTTGKLTVPSKAEGYWVTSIGNSAFQTCSNLTEIEFSEGITSIGEKVCYSRLFGLQRVTLPSTIEELGTYCFAANWRDYTSRSNLREVFIKASTPPTGPDGSSIDYTSAFYNIAEDAVLYVPTGSLAAYNVYPWTYWFSRIEERLFFEDQDGIQDLRDSNDLRDLKDLKEPWFDLSGRNLGSKPSKPGLYIQNGKKVVIK